MGTLAADALAVIGFVTFSAVCIGYVLLADKMVSHQ
jgi:hypothetical protein